MRIIKNFLAGRKKVKDELSSNIYRHIEDYHISRRLPPHYYAYCPNPDYYHSLFSFLENLKMHKNGIVTWRETTGWEPKIKFSWDKPQFFSPPEAADYVKKRNLLDDHYLYFESRWQVYSGKEEEQHYFDIDIYHTTYPMGCKEIGRLKKKVTLNYLLKQNW